MGNLGEFAALHIARSGTFAQMEKFAQNALQPLADISSAGLDLTYVFFHPSDPSADLLFIQEVKTTTALNLNYFNRLENDYEKLFSTNLNFTLQTRIQLLANQFEVERNNDAYAERVLRLGEATAQESAQVRLLPTGIHDRNVSGAVQKMVAVRSAIAAFGWPITSISPSAIALEDLENRMNRLAWGQL